MHKNVVTVLHRTDESQEHRCVCGSLLAKITPDGIELKCRKCKRVQLIPNSRITRVVGVMESQTGTQK